MVGLLAMGLPVGSASAQTALNAARRYLISPRRTCDSTAKIGRSTARTPHICQLRADVGHRLLLVAIAGRGGGGHAASARDRAGGGFGIDEVAAVRPQAQLDEGARIGGDLGLPAIGGLVADQGVLGALVPDAVGLAVEVVLTNQGRLNLAHPVGLDAALPLPPPGSLPAPSPALLLLPLVWGTMSRALGA